MTEPDPKLVNTKTVTVSGCSDCPFDDGLNAVCKLTGNITYTLDAKERSEKWRAKDCPLDVGPLVIMLKR